MTIGEVKIQSLSCRSNELTVFIKQEKIFTGGSFDGCFALT